MLCLLPICANARQDEDPVLQRDKGKYLGLDIRRQTLKWKCRAHVVFALYNKTNKKRFCIFGALRSH
jgi:hypothetical protein